MDSILTSIKKSRNIVAEDTSFDPEIIMYINTVFSTLTQLGVGPDKGFTISDAMTTWDDYLPPTNSRLEMVKTYMSLRVWLLFDPPISSSTTASIERQISELEWRIVHAVETV